MGSATNITMSAIRLHNLQFSWDNEHSKPLFIPHWEVDHQDSVFLHGPSGSGKSTLLNLVAGLLSPSHGDIHVVGEDLKAMSARQRDHFRACNIGMIFQQLNLLPYLNVEDNIVLSQHFAKTQTPRSRVLELCEALQLPAKILQKPANQLSVGQQQRVAVARALFHKPQLILADEPTSALDTTARDHFLKLLLEQCHEQKSTVIFVSHDQSLSQHFNACIALSSIIQSGETHAL